MAAIFSNVLRTAFKSTSRQVVHKLSRQSFTTSNQSFHNYKRIKVIIGIAAGGVVSIFCAVGFNVCYLESNTTKSPKKKIVVLGSGWGAVSFLKSLKPDEYDVSVVSPENYFLFTPLLPGVTVGTVESKSIAEPIRKIIMRKHKNGVRFFEAECTEVKVEEKKVVCRDLSEIVGKQEEFSLEYDYLVMAVGATTASYNIPGVKEHTHYLKNIQQAQAIRTNIIDSFETANIPGQPDHEVRRLLHFVVVGGGPTGVEFAAELRDFVKDDLIKYYPKDLVHKCRITLIDGMNKILNTYSEEISRYTEDHFYSEGIDIVTSTFVNGVEPCHMSLKDAKSGHIQNIAYGMCVWCAGIAPREITKQVMKDVPGQSNRLGLITNSYLKVKNARNIYAIGDCATIQNEKLVDCVDHLFGEEDIGSEENLTKEQFESILHKGMKKFPHLCHQFKEIEDAFESVEVDEGNMISKKEFKRFAMEADSRQTALPCTAQVAEQEGKYLGQLFSKHMVELESANMENVASFRYNHLGSFAYVGDNRAVLELPVIGAFKGWSTMWLWRGAYASEAVSLRMRTLILFDWIKSYAFGRDISRL